MLNKPKSKGRSVLSFGGSDHRKDGARTTVSDPNDMWMFSPRVFPVSVMFITASTALSRATVSLRAVVAWPL